jgi:hypothetical protein
MNIYGYAAVKTGFHPLPSTGSRFLTLTLDLAMDHW